MLIKIKKVVTKESVYEKLLYTSKWLTYNFILVIIVFTLVMLKSEENCIMWKGLTNILLFRCECIERVNHNKNHLVCWSDHLNVFYPGTHEVIDFIEPTFGSLRERDFMTRSWDSSTSEPRSNRY